MQADILASFCPLQITDETLDHLQLCCASTEKLDMSWLGPYDAVTRHGISRYRICPLALVLTVQSQILDLLCLSYVAIIFQCNKVNSRVE